MDRLVKFARRFSPAPLVMGVQQCLDILPIMAMPAVKIVCMENESILIPLLDSVVNKSVI